MKSGYIYIVSLGLLVATSCKKFVEVDTPYTLSTKESVFADAGSATSAQTAVYSNMVTKSLSYYLARRTGSYGDELTNLDNFFELSRQLYANALNPSTFNTTWGDHYFIVYQLNAVLEGLSNSAGINADIKAQLRGEALFTRSLIYFNLVNLFGDVPYITTTNYQLNAKAAKMAVAEIYSNLIADCKEAVGLLNANFVDLSGINTTAERTRPNKWAASALLARLDLYAEDYENAETASSEVINHSDLFFLTPSVNDVFLKNSTEAIWQLEKIGNTAFYSEGSNFILQYYVNTFGDNNSSTISPQLLDAFESDDDQRKINWIGTYVDFDGTSYLFPYKYKEGFTLEPTEYNMVLRLAEQYLIRAEARAQQGNTDGAIQDINAIRNRAGLQDYSGTIEKSALLTEILKQRQLELFTEGGHRWFDLKRTGQADAVMSVVADEKGGEWSEYKKLWPIPQSEIDKDPNLEQNLQY